MLSTLIACGVSLSIEMPIANIVKMMTRRKERVDLTVPHDAHETYSSSDGMSLPKVDDDTVLYTPAINPPRRTVN